jgi:hydroxyacylglutathione hydrolase
MTTLTASPAGPRVGRARPLAVGLRKRLSAVIPVLSMLLAAGPLGGQDDRPLEEAWKRLQSATPLFSEGVKGFNEGRHERASAAFKKCLTAMPEHAPAGYYLANLSYIGGDFPQALAYMEEALAALPLMYELQDYGLSSKSTDIDTTLQMLTTQKEQSICRELRELESLSNDLASKKTALEVQAERSQAARSRQTAHYLYFTGNVLFQLQRPADAYEKYQKAIALDPRHVSAYNNAAAILYLAGDSAAALALLQKAENEGLEDNLNLKLKHLIHEALGEPTEGILQEDLSPDGEGDLGVMRFALAVKVEGAAHSPLYENCYIVYNRATGQAILIDPGAEDPRIEGFVRERGLAVKAILNTHGHGDHTAADGRYAENFGAPVWIHRQDARALNVPIEGYLEDGQTFGPDGLTVRVFHTPGHTKGSLCFLIGDFLFSGDTLFRRDIGVVSSSKGVATSDKDRKSMVQSIKDKLLTLPEGTRVCPGHGRTSTVADEKAFNPFLAK